MLTVIEILGQVAVLVLMIRLNKICRLPSIFVACSLNLIVYVTLLSLLGRPHLYSEYFYTYWSSVAAQAIIRLWMTVDVLRSVPGLDLVPRRVILFIGAISLLMGAGAWQLTLSDGVSQSLRVVSSTILFDRCVNFAEIAIMIGALLGIWLLRFGWDSHGALVSYGVVFHLASEVVVSAMISLSGHTLRLAANGLESVLYIGVLAFWSFCFCLSPAETQSSNDPETKEFGERFLYFLSSQRKFGKP